MIEKSQMNASFNTQVGKLNTKYPISMAAMNYVSTPKLALAVSKAGGLGNVTTNYVDIKDIEILQGYQWCLSIFNLEDSKYIEQYKPTHIQLTAHARVVDDFIDYSRDLDTTNVIASTCDLPHIERFMKNGVSKFIVKGSEAAGWANSNSSAISLLIECKKAFPEAEFIVSGGIITKEQVAWYLSMGAIAVQVGSGFAFTKESDVAKDYKELVFKSTRKDLQWLCKFNHDIAPIKGLHSKHTMVSKNNLVSNPVLARQASWRFMREGLGNAVQGKKGMKLYMVGEGLWNINEELSVQQVMNNLTGEYNE